MTADSGDPAVIDLRDDLPPAGDQGSRGTCVAFALTALHAAALADDHPVALSEEYLFWAAKQRDGRAGDGTTYSAAFQGLSEDGQCRADLWPYDETTSHGAADYSPSAVAIVDAAARTADGRGLTPEVEELRQALRSGSPVTIAIPVWPEFDTADGINIGSLPSNIDQLPIEHAVVVAGHDPAHNAVLIRNSWGQAWGSSGYSWFDEQILDVSEPVGAWTLDRLTPHESAPEMDEADVPLFRGAAG